MRRRSIFCLPSNAVIAVCQKCSETFSWLPDNFDMRHRFNKASHEYCGGEIQPTDTGSVT